MKKFLLLGFFFQALIGAASAQVSRTDFVNAVNRFNSYENARNASGAISQFDAIASMINGQVAYLQSKIVQAERKYRPDSTKAYTDMRNAQSSPDANSPQMVNAKNEEKQTSQESADIHSMQHQQIAYKLMLTNLQPLRTNILYNKTAINNIYNSFLRTLA
jgi:hypothetical protein